MQPEYSGAGTPSGTEGFLTHIKDLGASLLEHVAMRVELLSIEVQEEKSRLVRLAVSAALVSALVIVSLVMLGILVLAIYWDTPNRVTAAATLAGAFVVLTIGSVFYVKAQLGKPTTLFEASAKELRLDAKTFLTPSTPDVPEDSAFATTAATQS
ncbi:MAG: phage holin family protein [Betaproteobacteria bacterium]